VSSLLGGERHFALSDRLGTRDPGRSGAVDVPTSAWRCGWNGLGDEGWSLWINIAAS
jgi:hypothetical protein